MLLDFKKHLQEKFSFLKGKKLLIAISGGVDSIVLTQLLNQLDFQISLAHCNFQLRGRESDLDEDLVKKLALTLKKPYYINHFDTNNYAKKNNLSIQMAARELRYKWFEEIIQKQKLNYVLTAHHADDNLETFLINLSRGTGLDGLTGMPEINNNIIRPLLPFTRNEIEIYAKENKFPWREDQSNIDTKYLRNKIRHDIIPIFKEINPSFMESFSKTQENLKGSKQIVKDRIDKILHDLQVDGSNQKNTVLKFDIIKLKSLNDPKAYLFHLFRSYGFTEWDDVLSLLDAQSGKQVYSKTHRLVKDRGFLLLSEIQSISKRSDNFEIKESDKKVNLHNFSLLLKNVPVQQLKNESFLKNNKQSVLIDKNLLNFPLGVRKWEKGDYFYPIGMQGKKKLSKYFKDEKFSLLQKENIWLLCSGKDIVWLIGKRMDERYKITDNTKDILIVKIVQ